MGFLTTFTVYNDGCDQILKHKDEFADIIYDACSSNRTKQYGLGCHANLIKAQKTRHADDVTVYVHCGNTVCEMNEYSSETEALMKRNSEYFETMLKIMDHNVKGLKKQFKEYKGSLAVND